MNEIPVHDNDASVDTSDRYFDQTQAMEEGWCISECIGSQYFPEHWLNLERWSESQRFGSDLLAEHHVRTQAVQGSDYHRKALRYMEAKNLSMVRGYQTIINKTIDIIVKARKTKVIDL